MMALGAGIVVPNVLRWYWWRLNGWGYSIGTLGGMVLSLFALFFPEQPMYVVFPLICFSSLGLSIIISFHSKTVNEKVLIDFYTSVRPFGLWKPIRNKSGLTEAELNDKKENAGITILNVLLGMAAITGLYLSPMYLVGHWYDKSLMWFVVVLISISILRLTWYNNLPDANETRNLKE